MTTTAEDLVWYAAYGSNMAGRRLACYLQGGCPPGGLRGQTGARDPAPPRDARPVRIGHALRFADSSAVWGGGKAFVSTERRGWAYARAWLLSRDQFDDLCAQENGRRPGSAAVPRVAQAGCIDMGNGPYDRLLHCGHLDGVSMVTLTSPRSPDPRNPSVPYLRIVKQGLEEAHGLGVLESAVYLASAEGVGATAAELALMLDTQGAAP